MFHFPTFPPHALCVQARVTPHDWCGVPPFGNPRINARLTAPRGLSQPPTSFIGSWCPGIHRVPLTTWPHKNPTHHPRKEMLCGPTRTLRTNKESKDARVHCAVLNVRPDTDHRHPTSPATPSGADSGMRCRPALTREETVARSLRTQQRAYNHRILVDSPPRTPRGACSTRSRRKPAAELVSVPPSSTTPEAPRSSDDEEPSCPGRGSAPTS